MKALIIGGAGFVGSYLIRELQGNGYTVAATCLPHEGITVNCEKYALDILDENAICELLDKVHPDVIFHLAAQSSVSVSWKQPQLTADVNVKGAVNVLEALRLYRSARIIVIGSGEEYGFIREDACPLREDERLRPGNIYAATKACQEMLAEIYSRAYGLDIVMTRSFNHSGPGQSETFVISDFCKQIAEIEMGIREGVIRVGNLSAKRDFTDVRDVVKAYRMLAEKGASGQIYNVGRGKAVEIQYILDTALSFSRADIEVGRDPNKMRASDIPIIEPDVSRILADTGWSAQIPVEQTIRDTLDRWRGDIAEMRR